MVKEMEIRHFIPLIPMFVLVLMPSLIWLLLKQVHSPWWLENVLSTPFVLLIVYCVLMLGLISFVSYSQCLGYFLINFVLAILLNNVAYLNNTGSLNNNDNVDKAKILSSQTCIEPISFFQFNIKYTEIENQLNELIEHLIAGKYHLIALQGVSQQSKQQIVERLSPYYPYFIRGESEDQHVVSDQLLFSQYAFANIKYYERGGSSFLISSQWQLPFSEIDLFTLHPPSPRNEKLWQVRNKTLYQLKHALRASTVKSSLVIGDFNLSKHSNRINVLRLGMNTEFINSWPKKNYISPFLGLAIDQLWVSKPATICVRQRINNFNWSDHYAIETQVDFNK